MKSGIDVEVISADQEARLAFYYSVQRAFDLRQQKNVVVADLGGGSHGNCARQRQCD